MTSRFDRQHWIERSSSGQGQWNQSPWPAPVDDDVLSSDGEDYSPSLLHRTSHPARRTAATSSSTGIIDFSFFQQDASMSSSSSSSSSSIIPTKPSFRRGMSHRAYRARSNSSVEAPLQDVISQRRHSRVQSMQEPAVAEKLHIDTILPVQLPPVNLRALSPVSVYPCTWWPMSSESDELKRSESTNSFLSASSDGSWHGDHGDEDPDKQLDDAIAKMSIKGRNSRMKNGLMISTYDYDEDDDPLHRSPIGHLGSQQSFPAHISAANDDDDDDKEVDEIKTHAGFFMSNLASYLLDDRSLGLPTPTHERRTEVSTPTQRTLSRSNSDTAFAGATSSISQLDAELSNLRQHRRLRAATDAPVLPSALQAEQDSAEQGEQRWAVTKLHSLWQWFLPSVDEQLEQDLFGYDRHSSLRSRSESLPSLTSTSTRDSFEEESGSESEDDNLHHHPTHLLDQTHLYEMSRPLKSALPSSSSSSSFRRVASFASKDTPSPLWDNRLSEEPYQRTWSSVLGLSSM